MSSLKSKCEIETAENCNFFSDEEYVTRTTSRVSGF